MDRRTVIVVFGVLLVCSILGALAGCDLGDVIKAKTPNGIQQREGMPAAMSLNDAVYEYQQWYNRTQADGAAWKANIDRADEIRGLLGNLAMTGLNDLGPEVAGVPIIGPSFTGLLALGGYFLGTGRLRKEKEKSYNAGLETGADTATRAASATKL